MEKSMKISSSNSLLDKLGHNICSVIFGFLTLRELKILFLSSKLLHEEVANFLSNNDFKVNLETVRLLRDPQVIQLTYALKRLTKLKLSCLLLNHCNFLNC